MSEIIEYSKTESALAELREQYSNKTYDVTTVKGMQEAITDRARIRQYRLDLEKARVALKAPALERSRLIDAEAKRITAELEALEDPIDATIKAEQARKEAERQERIELERQRVANIRQAIDSIPLQVQTMVGKPSVDIEAYRLMLANMPPPDPDFYQECLEEEIASRINAIASLTDMLERQLGVEARERQIIADREELARLRRADEERIAEQNAAAERDRKEQERLAALEAAKQAQEAKDAREAADAEAKKERDRLAAAQAEELRLQREQEETDRKERERLATEEAEQRGRDMAAAAAAREAETARLAAEREALEQEKRDIAERDRLAKVEQMNLVDAATEALGLLEENALGDHVITKNLRDVLERK